MALSRSQKGHFTIHQDDPFESTTTTAARPPSSQIPLAARTRSMTRLSSIASGHKVAKIDRRLGKVVNKENGALRLAATGPRSVLGEQMLNVQKGSTLSMDGLKRKAIVDEVGMAKRKRLEDGRNLGANTIRVVEEGPKTPVKVDKVGVQPTPAREILGSTAVNVDADADEEEETSPAQSSRFVARPPTPPRAHIHHPPESPQREPAASTTMDIDSPDRHSGGAAISTTPTKTLASRPLADGMAPVTPRTAAQTPRRVMGSISRFRAGPSSAKRPGGTPFSSDGTLASTSGLTDLDAQASSSAPPTMSHVEAGIGRKEATTSTLNTISKPTADRRPAVNVSPATVKTQAPAAVDIEMCPSALPAERSDLKAVSTASSSMPPPSRIPRPTASSRPRTAQAVPATSSQPSNTIPSSMSKASLSTAALGRGLPRAAPTVASTSVQLSTTSSTAPPAKRKPSYPSTLGSGPLARPRDRMVSGPTLYRQTDGTLGVHKEEKAAPSGRQSPRSVSEPVRRPTGGLSSSTSRREGLSLETSMSLAGLSDALNKLKVKRPDVSSESSRPRTQPSSLHARVSEPKTQSTASAGPTTSTTIVPTSSRLASVHRPRYSALPVPASGDSSTSSEEDAAGEHAGDRSLAAIMSSTSGGGCFRGVVAFIDVKTADGEDAGPIFTDMIRALGGKVLSRLTENVTHIIYKSGKPTTLSWYRKQEEDERPHIVGISWVTRSKAQGERLDEAAFVVNVADEDVFQKRRKSMEPKALTQSTLPSTSGGDGGLNLASIRRKSMMYAPRISSPLKKTFVRMDVDD